MVVAITDLNITETYLDDTKLTQAQLNATEASVETYVNTSIVRNLEQLAKDAFGNANYTFTNNGTPSFTNTLFDKQTGLKTYNAGDITLTNIADAGWVDVDAVNAAITFTPEIIGKYKATFTFTHRVASALTTEFSADVGFRIADAITSAPSVTSGGRIPATAGGSGEFYNSFILTYIFTWTTTAAKTVRLQKYNRTMTNVLTNVVAAAAATGEIFMSVEKV